MVEGVSIGNETVELLDREASQWKTSYLSPNSKTFEGKYDVIGVGDRSKSQRSKFEFSKAPLNQRPGDVRRQNTNHHHNNNTINGISKTYADVPRVNDTDSSSQIDPDRRKLKHHDTHHDTHEIQSKSSEPKKRKYNDNYTTKDAEITVAGDPIPSLQLDSDLDINGNDIAQESPEKFLTLGTHNTSTIITTDGEHLSGLNLRLTQPLTTTSNSDSPHTHKRVSELESALEVKEQEILRLKQQLESIKSQHEAEVSNIIKKLHGEYSKQASGKLRILYKVAETKARKHAEELLKTENEELKALVQSERAEKTELVKACDEYLKLNGF